MNYDTFAKEARMAGFKQDIHKNFVYRDFQIKPSHNYYFILTGFVPLKLAKKLYTSMLGKKAIRVSGHCGCPAPEEPWIDWYHDDGKKVIKKSELEAFKRMFPEKIKDYHFEDFPSEYNGYITQYHIDTVEALALFVETAKEYYND